jgi:surfeit locus 1 family protein
MRFRPLPWMTAAALPALALLVMLGSWQWTRFEEKRALQSAPAPMPQALSAVLDRGASDFAPVIVDGAWRAQALAVYAVQDGVRGARRFSVLDTAEGPIIAERGFVADQDEAKAVTTGGPVRLVGVLRASAKANAFTPDNDPVKGVYFWPDTAALAKALGAERLATPFYLAPQVVDPLATGRPVTNLSAGPRGANQLPADRHFGYALTWWGLALALVGVYLALHWRAGRLRLS